MSNPLETPRKNETLSMENIEAGYVIEDENGRRTLVEEVIRNPKCDKDGVPGIVKGRYIDNNVDTVISFSAVDSGQPIADWKKYKVISKPETAE